MKSILSNFSRYMHDVLGLMVQPKPWRDAGRMPVFLHDSYQFANCILLDTPCLLMYKNTKDDIKPLALAKQIILVRQHWAGVVLFLSESMAPYFRLRLIEQNIPFVVPGNQLYLPPLGVDLREQYNKKRPAIQTFSPATQTVILYALCHDEAQLPSSATEMAKLLGYSRMTMTRVFDELEAEDIGTIINQGNERRWSFPEGMQLLWESTRPHMRTPVKKRLWTIQPRGGWAGVPAGLTALSSYTMLATPERPVYAMSSKEWALLGQTGYTDEYEIPEVAEKCLLELWSYPPHIFAGNDRVDPFSLYLSLQYDADERVQLALTQMMEQIAW